MRSQLVQLLPKLRRFAFSLTANIADADDLVQSTVERLLKKERPDYKLSTALVFTVCKNIWIDEVRKRKVRSSEEFSERDHTNASEESIQEQDIEVQELMQSVDTLPEKSREVLSMVAIAGLSYAEAAAELDVPIGTVMSRISRARAMLADAIKHIEQPNRGGRHGLH